MYKVSGGLMIKLNLKWLFVVLIGSSVNNGIGDKR